MKSIEIKNRQIIQDLDNFVDIKNEFIDLLLPSGDNLTEEKKQYYLSEEYLNKIIDMKTEHDGFPETINSYSLLRNGIQFDQKNPSKEKQDRIKHLSAKFDRVNDAFKTNYCVKRTALAAIYPPGGMISWHNNANASAYNLIFTWSENGDGWFKYVDSKTKKIVTIHDHPGWQFKYGYFGSYHDPEIDLCYHAASTNCWRITVAFVFDRSIDSENMQNWFLEDIATEL